MRKNKNGALPRHTVAKQSPELSNAMTVPFGGTSALGLVLEPFMAGANALVEAVPFAAVVFGPS